MASMTSCTVCGAEAVPTENAATAACGACGASPAARALAVTLLAEIGRPGPLHAALAGNVTAPVDAQAIWREERSARWALQARLDAALAAQPTRRELADTQAALEGARQGLVHLGEELAALRASTSWRVTAPLRRVAHLLRPAPAPAPAPEPVVQEPLPEAAAPAPAHPPAPEFQACLTSMEDWLEWEQTQGGRLTPETARDIVAAAQRDGVEGPLIGRFAGSEVTLEGNEPRESLLAGGLNSRLRATLQVLAWDERAEDIWKTRIYAHEALTPLALHLRGRYPRFLGSEYAPDEASARAIWPVPAVDITQSPFPDASFDFVLSHEVLEHVPDLGAALRDTARILVPGGALIATFPFDWNAAHTSIRARLRADGSVEHLAPPEYHGNPVDPEGGSLVFQIPGWDVLDLCRGCGFSLVQMIFIGSARAGITSRDIPGVFVLRAVR